MERVSFEELELSREVLKAVKEIGFEETTAIQSTAIPLIMEGRDVIGQSQTGTGKTAAFGLPAIELSDPKKRCLQVLALCPTRELAVQACEEIGRFAKYKRGLSCVPIYGGQPIDRQIKALRQGAQIVIGTPGRVMDHIRRGTLKLDQVFMVILDEADEMLNMGFRDDIETILKDVPKERQTTLFSATMSKEIMGIAKRYQNKPELVKVVHQQLTVPSIEQYYIELPSSKRPEVLGRIIDLYDFHLSIVFCNTKRQVDELVSDLQFRGYLAEGLHGDMKQQTRTQVMDRFKKGRVDILVATDVAARGIDVDDVDAVFNYDIPQDIEYYVHRIGRTGRAGRSGQAFTFVSGRRQMMELKDIQRYAKTRINRKPVPTLDELEELKTNKLISEIEQVIENGDLERYYGAIDQMTEGEMTSVDIAAALMKMTLEKDNPKPEADEFADTGAEPGMVRLFINIGKNHGVDPRHIVGAIAGESGLPGKAIGSIDIYDKYTFVEVPKENAKQVLKIMKNCKIKGKSINIEKAGARPR